MLIYAPNTPRLQFELGVLCYRLGAYDVARSYFEQVYANPSVPPDVAEQVRDRQLCENPHDQPLGLSRAAFRRLKPARSAHPEKH
jgi:hypothetical protein